MLYIYILNRFLQPRGPQGVRGFRESSVSNGKILRWSTRSRGGHEFTFPVFGGHRMSWIVLCKLWVFGRFSCTSVQRSRQRFLKYWKRAIGRFRLTLAQRNHSRGGHERFEQTFSSVWGPSDALSICFQLFWTLGRSGCTLVQRNRPGIWLESSIFVVFVVILPSTALGAVRPWIALDTVAAPAADPRRPMLPTAKYCAGMISRAHSYVDSRGRCTCQRCERSSKSL